MSTHLVQPVNAAVLPWAGFLQAVPKMELHCHLLGTVQQATFEDLARAAKAPITQEEIAAFYTRGDKPVGVLRVLRALDAHLLRSPDDFYRITVEYLHSLVAHNVRYTEFFWNPTGTAEVSRLAYPQVLAAIRRAIADAQTQWGLVARLVPAIDRQAEPRAALEMVQAVVEHRCECVVGIGIDYNEVDRPPELFAAAYALARQAGLKTTAHAGEFGCPWPNVQTAIDQLQVDRVDHGYTVLDNPELLARCVQLGQERDLVFTVVPTNSYYLRTLGPERWAQDHPIRAMLRAGLRLHPNTDDPTLHHVTPSLAWLMLQRDFGFTEGDLLACMHNGLASAWIDDSTRQQWRAEWTAQWQTLAAEHGVAQGAARFAAIALPST